MNKLLEASKKVQQWIHAHPRKATIVKFVTDEFDAAIAASEAEEAAISGAVGVNSDTVRATGRAHVAPVAPSAGTPSGNSSLDAICPHLETVCNINRVGCEGKDRDCPGRYT